MNEEEKGIEIPCVHCGRQLKVSPGQSGLTSEDKIVLNLPGIACDDSCVDELLDMYDPLTCVYELSSELADSAMMEMQFVKGTEAAVDFFLQLFPTSADVIDAAEALGGVEAIKNTFIEFQKYLYQIRAA